MSDRPRKNESIEAQDRYDQQIALDLDEARHKFHETSDRGELFCTLLALSMAGLLAEGVTLPEILRAAEQSVKSIEAARAAN